MFIRPDWRREFKSLDVDVVRARAAALTWTEDKLQAAHRWLWWQQYWWQVAAVIIATIAVLAASVLL